jgi:acyl-CoA dehydrogenase
MASSPTRDRLTAGIFIPEDLSEPLGRIEDALPKVIAAEAVEKKLRTAQRKQTLVVGDESRLMAAAVAAGIITAQEAETLEQANAARSEVIRVDDFPADYWLKGGEHE